MRSLLETILSGNQIFRQILYSQIWKEKFVFVRDKNGRIVLDESGEPVTGWGYQSSKMKTKTSQSWRKYSVVFARDGECKEIRFNNFMIGNNFHDS